MSIHRRWGLVVGTAALIVTALAAIDGSRSAGGADSYGYVSQADAWLAGDAVRAPLPRPEVGGRPPVTRWVMVPLGWKPSPVTGDIVPLYAPGYPLMLAAVKAVAGHAAMFYVVPVMAGLLVWSTFLLGCRLGRPGVGAIAALIVASSATVLFMAMAPMSDVPSAALWTLALVFVLSASQSRRSALGAGVLTALAILVRPNLLPIAALFGAWLAANDVRAHGARIWRGRVLPFAASAAMGAIAVAAINTWWYGRPGESGYGSLGGYFGAGHVADNAVRYAKWLVQAETPLAAAGLLVVLFAPVFVNRRRDVIGVPALLWSIVAWIWGMYLFYLVFDAWWFMRFLLPTWPIVAIASASLVSALWERGRGWRAVAAAVVAASMSASVWFAWDHSAFRVGLTESRYPQVARAVASLTDVGAGIITLQHSGTVRYYGGRATLRWDVLGPRDFSPLVNWLRAYGHHPYLLVDAAELPRARALFGADPALPPADWPPLATFFNGETLLFDLDATQPTISTTLGVYSSKAIPPATGKTWLEGW